MKKNIIPIVFTFDNNYSLPAAVAIKSLVDTGNEDTWYEIYCLYHDLSDHNRRSLDKIAKINWIKVDKSLFNGFPISSEYPLDVYYRLIIHDILPQYDKILYSDVDVLFRCDLTDVLNVNLEGMYWAGVPLERNETPSQETISAQVGQPDDPKYMSGHTKFSENKNDLIFASGFMVINSKKMRADQMTKNFFQIINQFSGRLKMFDLDVLNLACQNGTIKSLPLEYCVFEDIAIVDDYKKSNLYPFLSRVFLDKEIERATQYPAILHYTGSNETRIWNREEKKQPMPYRTFFSAVVALI